jgi:putative peptidoglycan lipid II flippase
MTDRALLRSSAGMVVGTVVSRITGLVRWVALVAALGTGPLGDAFATANTVPNMLYILLAGGVLNSVYVPQLVKAITHDDDGGDGYAHRLLTVTMLVLAAMTVPTVWAAPLILRFAVDPSTAKYQLAVMLARYCLVQIFFYGLFTMMGQILNARGRFGPMMWAPIVNNVVAIGTFIVFITITVNPTVESVTADQASLLGIGTTAGVVLQALVLLPVLRATGFRWRVRWDLRGSGLGHAARLGGWTVAFVAVNQLGYAVIVRLANSAGEEAARSGFPYAGYIAYDSAYLWFALPHAVVAVSVVTALLPRMSRAVAEHRMAAVREDLSGGIRLLGVALVPATGALIALGPTLTGVVAGFGRSTPAGAQLIGQILMAYAVGLVPFSLHYLALRGFYAQEDTRTPFIFAVLITAVNVIFAMIAAAILPARWVVVGLAAAYGLAYALGAATSLTVLRRRVGGLDGRRVVGVYGRLFVAAIPAATVAYLTVRVIRPAVKSPLLGDLVALLAGSAVLVLVFGVLAWRLRISEVTELLGSVRGKHRR